GSSPSERAHIRSSRPFLECRRDGLFVAGGKVSDRFKGNLLSTGHQRSHVVPTARHGSSIAAGFQDLIGTGTREAMERYKARTAAPVRSGTGHHHAAHRRPPRPPIGF